ncbi:MAG: MBL fold metallo-hydrolase [Candidatus Shapirobacteria bacterium]|nr:MBL fold metallo-hydrolase [Candidatus Shapirobacteria bacterium]MDD3002277.1 MBL fold metallo-hydrolase [Candidatus Shapirobacteria bacterium]MDD4382718.1 MBL fold metallo-hydrolase [Candidatus Shapirobacteria bacterium]
MEIKVLENNSVYLKGKKENVLINPSEKKRDDSKYPSRIFLFTSEKYDGMGFDSDKILIRAPGEYEVGGVEINGYPAGGENTFFIINIDGIKVIFLGDLDEALSDKRIEKVDSADVLLAPVLIKDSLGGKLVLDWAKKWGVNYLIPMGYSDEDKNNLDKFLDQADQEGLEPAESLKVDKNDLPDGLELKVLKKV